MVRISDDDRRSTTCILMPSPLLGGPIWEPVAEAVRERGWNALVVPPLSAAPESPADVVAHLLATVPTDGRFILVPHSNAGLYVPQLGTQRLVAGTVFVDARLPPSQGRIAMATPDFVRMLASLVQPDGLLPPWTRWWSEEDLEGLYPSPAVRDAIEGETPSLPLAYFQSSIAVPAGWDRARGAYLAFGVTYDDDREAAAARGWTTETMPGGHLHMLHDPDGVADAILRLAAQVDPPHSLDIRNRRP